MKWAAAGYSQLLRYRTLRALGFLTTCFPGVPLRFTPGFMLPPASRVLHPVASESRAHRLGLSLQSLRIKRKTRAQFCYTLAHFVAHFIRRRRMNHFRD